MLPHLNKTPSSELDWFEALAALTRYLRGPSGCPWDRKQSAADFARFAREEMDELLEAFEQGDDGHVAEELGDTLFTLLAVAAAAETEGRFTLTQTLEGIHEKMVRRHGHIFGEHSAETAEDAVSVWEEIKKAEKGR
jgi:tetrapyrrole methylase family protein/MazG family protein